METRAKPPPPSQKPPKAAGRSDIFQTDDEDVRPLLPYLPRHWTLWENACGDGQIVRFLRSQGYSVTGTDIMSGFDFLAPLCRPPPHDAIVTNPPYKPKTEWLRRCFELGKPFALFLPITTFDSKERRALFKEYGIEVLMPDSRPTFTTPSGKKGGSWFYAAWFCHGLNLPAPITYA